MATEFMCKGCGRTFERFTTLQTKCFTCTYNTQVSKPNRQKPIKRIGKVTQKWLDHRKQWIKDNPGPWVCYLQIHEWCPINLDIDTLTLDHVIARSNAKNYSKRHDDENLKPACTYCNNKKGSKSIDKA